MKLYESGEDYLEAVLMLQKKNGMVRSVDLKHELCNAGSCQGGAVKAYYA